ncbi:HECT-domain-containing protein [Pseudocohnilembus persalinus]|uniref:HECT-type E3 ubiquitin transferase n=1 Tax=Pseudocohnilembus persalinus TaxID=266149 RepID=A0A0V0QVN0_PSEPJ|nr:HECT-domain-containing protein [Pseudocohnilembus persalinus]|eukprot:KRX06241.1 HECT-domain-containing protein [Pseudocohnilembus persalinus]
MVESFRHLIFILDREYRIYNEKQRYVQFYINEFVKALKNLQEFYHDCLDCLKINVTKIKLQNKGEQKGVNLQNFFDLKFLGFLDYFQTSISFVKKHLYSLEDDIINQVFLIPDYVKQRNLFLGKNCINTKFLSQIVLYLEKYNQNTEIRIFLSSEVYNFAELGFLFHLISLKHIDEEQNSQEQEFLEKNNIEIGKRVIQDKEEQTLIRKYLNNYAISIFENLLQATKNQEWEQEQIDIYNKDKKQKIFLYEVLEIKGVAIRKSADYPGIRTGQDLKLGFHLVDKVITKSLSREDGTFYQNNFYRLQDGRGWVFDSVGNFQKFAKIYEITEDLEYFKCKNCNQTLQIRKQKNEKDPYEKFETFECDMCNNEYNSKNYNSLFCQCDSNGFDLCFSCLPKQEMVSSSQLMSSTLFFQTFIRKFLFEISTLEQVKNCYEFAMNVLKKNDFEKYIKQYFDYIFKSINQADSEEDLELQQGIQEFSEDESEEEQQENDQFEDVFKQSLPTFYFSQDYKHQYINVIQPYQIQSTRQNCYKFSLIDPPLNKNKRYRAVFEINKVSNNWIAVGLAQKKTVMKNNYGFKYAELNHGAYMISSNGGSWSSHQEEYNNCVKAFRFSNQDVIIMDYFPQQKLIKFTKRSTNYSYTLPVQIPTKDSLHLAVLMFHVEDQVEFRMLKGGINKLEVNDDSKEFCFNEIFLNNNLDIQEIENEIYQEDNEKIVEANGPNLENQVTDIEFAFSKTLKNKFIEVQGNNKIKIQKTGNYKLAFLDKYLRNDKNYQFSFKIEEQPGNNWIAFGICRLNIAKETNFIFTPFNGIHVLASNGGIFSETDLSVNNKKLGFGFIKGDEIIVSVDNLKQITFEKVGFPHQSCTLKIQEQSGQLYYPCVLAIHQKDVVTVKNAKNILQDKKNRIEDEIEKEHYSDPEIVQRFKSSLKHQNIKIINENTIQCVKNGIYALALYDKALNNEMMTTFDFKVEYLVNNWTAVGIFIRQVAEEDNFAFQLTEMENGSVMISSNGGIWSHQYKNQNNIISSFIWKMGDIIKCKFDPKNWQVVFTNMRTLEQQVQDLPTMEEYVYYPAISCFFADEIVKIDNIQEYNYNDLKGTELPYEQIIKDLKESQLDKKLYNEHTIFTFEEEFVNPMIEILGQNTVKNTKKASGPYHYAVMDSPFKKDHFYRYYFEILENTRDWIAVGACIIQKAKKEDFNFIFGSTQHGGYMVSSNRGTWNSHDPHFNRQLKSFQFFTGDKIIVQFDPFKQQLTFTKYGTNAFYTMPVKMEENEELHPCVAFVYPDDEIKFELLGEWQDSNENQGQNNVDGINSNKNDKNNKLEIKFNQEQEEQKQNQGDFQKEQRKSEISLSNKKYSSNNIITNNNSQIRQKKKQSEDLTDLLGKGSEINQFLLANISYYYEKLLENIFQANQQKTKDFVNKNLQNQIIEIQKDYVISQKQNSESGGDQKLFYQTEFQEQGKELLEGLVEYMEKYYGDVGALIDQDYEIIMKLCKEVLNLFSIQKIEKSLNQLEIKLTKVYEKHFQFMVKCVQLFNKPINREKILENKDQAMNISVTLLLVSFIYKQENESITGKINIQDFTQLLSLLQNIFSIQQKDISYIQVLFNIIQKFVTQDIQEQFLKANLELKFKTFHQQYKKLFVEKYETIKKPRNGVFNFTGVQLILRELVQINPQFAIDVSKQVVQIKEFKQFEFFISIGRQPKTDPGLQQVINFLTNQFVSSVENNYLKGSQQLYSNICSSIYITGQLLVILMHIFPLSIPIMMNQKCKIKKQKKNLEIFTQEIEFLDVLIKYAPYTYGASQLLLNSVSNLPFYFESKNQISLRHSGEKIRKYVIDQVKKILSEKYIKKFENLKENNKKIQEFQSYISLFGFLNLDEENAFEILKMVYLKNDEMIIKIILLTKFFEGLFYLFQVKKQQIFKYKNGQNVGKEFKPYAYFYYQQNLNKWINELQNEYQEEIKSQQQKTERKQDEISLNIQEILKNQTELSFLGVQNTKKLQGLKQLNLFLEEIEINGKKNKSIESNIISLINNQANIFGNFVNSTVNIEKVQKQYDVEKQDNVSEKNKKKFRKTEYMFDLSQIEVLEQSKEISDYQQLYNTSQSNLVLKINNNLDLYYSHLFINFKKYTILTTFSESILDFIVINSKIISSSPFLTKKLTLNSEQSDSYDSELGSSDSAEEMDEEGEESEDFGDEEDGEETKRNANYALRLTQGVDQYLSESEKIKRKIQILREQKTYQAFYEQQVNKEEFKSMYPNYDPILYERWQDVVVQFTDEEIEQLRKMINKLKHEDRMELILKLDENVLMKIDPKLIKEVKQKNKKLFPLIDDISLDSISDLSEENNQNKSSSSSDDFFSDEDDENNRNMDELFKGYFYDHQQEKLFSKRQTFAAFPRIEDEVLSIFIFALLLEQKTGSKHILLSDLLHKACINPINCYKIYDAISLILLLQNEDLDLLEDQKSPNLLKKIIKQKIGNDSKILPQNSVDIQELKYSEDKSRYEILQIFSIHRGGILEMGEIKYGYSFLMKGVFTKTEAIQILDQNYQLPKETDSNYITVNSLPCIQQFREQIKNQFGSQLSQGQSYSYYIIMMQFRLIYMNISEIEKSYDNLREFYLDNFKFNYHDMVLEGINSKQQITGNILCEIDDVDIEEKEKFITKKIKWPQINFLQLCVNNEHIFKKTVPFFLLNKVLQESQKDILNILITVRPSLFNQVLDASFNICEEICLNMTCLLEKLEKYIKNFFEQSENASFNKRKPLDQQIVDKSVLFNICSDLKNNLYDQYDYQVQDYHAKLELVGEMIQKLMNKLVFSKFYKLKQLDQENLKRQINNIRHLKQTNKKLFEKKRRNLAAEQKKQKIELKNKIQNFLKEILNEHVYLKNFFRLFMEFSYGLINFVGKEAHKNGINFYFQDILAPPIGLLIILGYNFNIASLQQEEIVMLDEEEEEEGNLGSETSKNDNPNFELSTIFDYLFGKVFGIIEMENYLHDILTSKERNYFSHLSLQRCKQNMPFTKKLKAIKSLAQKRAQKLMKEKKQSYQVNCQIQRNSCWASTVKNIFQKMSPHEIVLNDIKIEFKGEVGLDWGGLRSEWLSILGQEVFNPNFGLFQKSANGRSIQPSPLAFLVPDYLKYFRYLGRLVGKALIQNWTIEVSFTKNFLKHILDKPLYIEDLEDVDEELMKQLQWTLQNNIDSGIGVNFVENQEVMGDILNIELEEDGANKEVTEENKKEYINKLCKKKMTDDIYKQTIEFKKGLYDIIPKKALNYLSQNELGLYLSGMPKLDIQKLKDSVKLTGYNKNDITVIQFFEVLEEFDDTMKANFVFFFSGSFKIPLDNFEENSLEIIKANSILNLPVAHTCFLQIELPDYKDRLVLKQKLVQALVYGNSGFHIL